MRCAIVVIVVSCLFDCQRNNVCSSQQPGCSFPSYMTRYSREVWLDNDYHHARETAFVYGRVHKGRFGRATGVVRDSPDAWVTKVQHNSVTQRWRSHKEITFTRDGSQMVIALKQIIPCELQREEDSTDDQFASVIDFHPVLNRSLRQVIGGNTSKGMASNPGSANEGLLNINNFTDSRYYQSSTKQQRGEVTQSPKKVHYWSAETNARILRANGSTARPLANKKRGSKVTDNRRAAREGGEACYEVDLLYKRKCLSKIAPNKYLVLHTSGGVSFKTCIKFAPKSQAIVILYEGPKDDELAKVCPENLLERDEWPWIAPYQSQLSFCPLVGGFDFKTEKMKEEFCPDQWRPSRLEAECIKGEGMTLTFVHPACSPFFDKRLTSHMICWGTWEENGFTFVSVSSTDDKSESEEDFPRYIFRYQSIQGDPSSMLWFFSPIAPINDNTRFTPFLQLKINRSDSRACYDDSWHCEEHSRKGACSNSGMFQYANHCKRTCGLCNLIPPRIAECHFPADVRTEWRLYEADHLETVAIGTDNITFTSLGTFLCKSKHWEQNYYKLFSYYENGCRLRYTCLHLVDKSDDVLHFQISKSSIEDKSFEACENFRDDDPPTNSTFRSRAPKSLVASRNFKDSTCGLSGALEVRLRDFDEGDVTTNQKRGCSGLVSDWSRRSCGSHGRLKISMSGSKCPDVSHLCGDGEYNMADTSYVSPFCNSGNGKDGMQMNMEFSCSSYYVIDHMHAVLVTKTTGKLEKYMCWGIILNSDRSLWENSKPSQTAWKELFLMRTTQHCGTLDLFAPYNLAQAPLALRVENGNLQRPCPYLPSQSPTPHRDQQQHHQIQREGKSSPRDKNRQYLNTAGMAGVGIRADPSLQFGSGRMTRSSVVLVLVVFVGPLICLSW